MIKRLNLFLYLIIGITLVIFYYEIKNYISIKEGAKNAMKNAMRKGEKKAEKKAEKNAEKQNMVEELENSFINGTFNPSE